MNGSISDEADRVWAAISKHDFSKMKSLLSTHALDEIREIIELPVKHIIVTRYHNSRDGLSCLHYAAKKGQLDTVELLVGKGIYVDITSDGLGWTALHYAVFFGHVKVTKTLLHKGASGDIRDQKHGFSPLHIAINTGNRKVIVMLIHAGANTNVQDDNGNSPLHQCFIADNMWTPREQAEVVDYLLSHEADPMFCNNIDDTPLHMAVRYSSSRLSIRILAKQMKLVGNLAVWNYKGETAFHLCKNPDIIDILLDVGFDSNVKGSNGQTALHSLSDSLNIVRHLLDKKADKTIKDSDARLPLHYAVSQRIPELENIKLLDCISSINCQDVIGNSPLHYACDNNYLQFSESNLDDPERVVKIVSSGTDPVLSYLIQKGASVNLQNKSGETPLHGCLRQKYLTKANILANAGANPFLEDSQGVSARDINPKWFNKIIKQGVFKDYDIRDYPLKDIDRHWWCGAFLCLQRSRSLTRTDKDPLKVEGSVSPNKSIDLKLSTDSNKNLNRSNNTDTNEELTLTRQITSLQNEVKDVKELLEEFTDKKKEHEDKPAVLERQMTSLHGEVAEVKGLLEKALQEDR